MVSTDRIDKDNMDLLIEGGLGASTDGGGAGVSPGSANGSSSSIGGIAAAKATFAPSQLRLSLSAEKSCDLTH